MYPFIFIAIDCCLTIFYFYGKATYIQLNFSFDGDRTLNYSLGQTDKIQ
jgi:hypothetical protein